MGLLHLVTEIWLKDSFISHAQLQTVVPRAILTKMAKDRENFLCCNLVVSSIRPTRSPWLSLNSNLSSLPNKTWICNLKTKWSLLSDSSLQKEYIWALYKQQLILGTDLGYLIKLYQPRVMEFSQHSKLSCWRKGKRIYLPCSPYQFISLLEHSNE